MKHKELWVIALTWLLGGAQAEGVQKQLALGMYTWAEDEVPAALDPSIFPYMITYGSDGIKTKAAVRRFMRRYDDFRVIFSLKDSFEDSRWFSVPEYCQGAAREQELLVCMVRNLDTYDGIYGWYLVDEPTLTMKRRKFQRILMASRNISTVSRKPIFIEDVPRSGSWDTLAHAGDVLMTSVYPGTRGNFFTAYTLFDDLKKRYPSKRVWAVVQAFDNGHYRKRTPHHRPPTIDEMRVMGHLAVAAGAEGVIFFSLRDLARRGDTVIFHQMNDLGKELIAFHEKLMLHPIEIRPDTINRKLDGWLQGRIVLKVNASGSGVNTYDGKEENGKEGEKPMSVWKAPMLMP